MCDVYIISYVCWWLPNPGWFQDAARKQPYAYGVAQVYERALTKAGYKPKYCVLPVQ